MTRVSEQRSLWPHSVPNWQPSCQRLPPASWALVGLGVGMMALCCVVLCCAVLCCVEYSCSGPSVNSAGICRSEITRQHIGNRHYALSVLPVFLFSVSSDFKRATTDNLHHLIVATGGPLLPQKYIHIHIVSRYPGTMTAYFKVLGSQCHYSMYYSYCIPEIHAFVKKFCRPIIYQDIHNRFIKTSTLHNSTAAERLQKKLRMFHC